MSTVSFIIKIGNTNSGGFRLIEVRCKNFRFMCCCHTIGRRGRGAVQNMFTLATSTPIFCLGFSSLPLMTTEGGGRVVAMTTEDRGCAAAMTTEDGGHVVAMTTENGGYVVAMTTEDRGTCNYIFFSTKLWSREARNNKKMEKIPNSKCLITKVWEIHALTLLQGSTIEKTDLQFKVFSSTATSHRAVTFTFAMAVFLRANSACMRITAPSMSPRAAQMSVHMSSQDTSANIPRSMSRFLSMAVLVWNHSASSSKLQQVCIWEGKYQSHHTAAGGLFITGYS